MNKKRTPRLRAIPAVEKVLQTLGDTGLPRPVVADHVRRELAALRSCDSIPGLEKILAGIELSLGALRLSRIQPVVNATGILIHTNLGRAPLGDAVMETIQAVGTRYNNLEMDLATGTRGGRAAYLERCLALLCRADAATVVNNCAGALVLILRHATRAKPEVVISRGELVQIGGGFRIPEILEASGARLREVGTTNRTTLRDYQKALNRETGLILKVHRSNFFMEGFVESPTTEALASLARSRRVPLVEDLGSGAIMATETIRGLDHEPTPAEVLKKGVDLVCFSGDKLLGGPQAGIIAGKGKWVSALKQDPFFRALRCDKLVLSGLQTVAEAYLEPDQDSGQVPGLANVPVVSMIRVSLEGLRGRAVLLQQALAEVPAEIRVTTTTGQLGGGTLPRSGLESVALEVRPRHLSAKELNARLRAGQPPVIGCVSGGQCVLDLRAVFPDQDQALAHALRRALVS